MTSHSKFHLVSSYEFLGISLISLRDAQCHGMPCYAWVALCRCNWGACTDVFLRIALAVALSFAEDLKESPARHFQWQ